MFMSLHQTIHKHETCIELVNKSFENMAAFKYLWTTSTYQNCIHEEIKSRPISGNACYHAVQNLLSSRPLSKNVKIKICKTIILPAVLYGCKTWSLTLRENHRLRVFENRVLRRIFGLKRAEVRRDGRNCMMRSSIVCTLHQILLGWSNQGVWDGCGM
jgi:hypothetical protein